MRRVTIIDDSKETQKKLIESVASLELQSFTAPPFFDERIEKRIAEFRPQVILLDLYLLNDADSGFRVLRRLKYSPLLKGIPVIVISKYIDSPENKYAIRAREFGAEAALPKVPFDKIIESITKKLLPEE